MNTLKHIVDRYGLNSKTPGFCCVIQKGQNTLLNLNVGCSGNMPLSSESNFRLASVTKQFTALAILQLIASGHLHLGMSLRQLFPEFPAYGNGITLHHLLSHMSGLPDYEDRLMYMSGGQVYDPDVFTQACREKEILFVPGRKYQYSNGAYCLLALIVTKYSGMRFGEYLHQNIFQPAEMHNSYLNDAPQISNRVYGYMQTQSGWTQNDQDKTSATQGDGGIYSSANDLLKWHGALYESKVFPSHYMQLMTTPHMPRSDQGDESVGYGLFIKKYGDRVCYRHGGESIGFRNAVLYVPDQKLSIIFLSNVNEIDIDPLMDNLINECLKM